MTAVIAGCFAAVMITLTALAVVIGSIASYAVQNHKLGSAL